MQYGLRLPLVDVAFSRRQLTLESDHFLFARSSGAFFKLDQLL